MLKIFKRLIPISAVVFFVGCDKNFKEINTNPYSINNVDPSLLFAGAQTTHHGSWVAENTIIQQFVTPYNTGATLGFSFNSDIDGNQNQKWGEYTGSVKNLIQALNMLGPNTTRVNLKSMIRIWKAYVFMGLVDNYGDVPYSEAGKAVTDAIFFPKYDDDAAIYEDLYKEFKEAIAALNPSGDYVAADLFYGANAAPSVKTTNAADQVAKWKKLGNSLLLRLGMRYSENPATQAKAKSIVSEAFAGGVMTSNADNAFVIYNGTTYSTPENGGLRNFSQYNYAAKPFVDQLKSTNDPRGKFMIAQFANPGNVADATNPPDTVLAKQSGVPIGAASGALPTRGDGLAFSQFNVNILASPAAPDFYVTYPSTALLLAEAAHRGWIPGGDAQAKTYYEDAIRADMQLYSLYPGTTPITTAQITAYLNDPAVLYIATDALKLINTQYWIVNVRNGTEAWANFRRTGYPALTPNPVIGDLGSVGFVTRLTYPDIEASSNAEKYSAAIAAYGGDKLTGKVFWDQ